MRKLLLIAAGTIAAAALVVVTGHAQRAGGPLRPNGPGMQAPAGPNGPNGPGPGRAQGPAPGQDEEILLRRLDLTEAQHKQARDILLKARDEDLPAPVGCTAGLPPLLPGSPYAVRVTTKHS